MRRSNPGHNLLARLAELRIPARLALEWRSLAATPLLLLDSSGESGRFLSLAPSRCTEGPRAPPCVGDLEGVNAADGVRCGSGRGLHLVRVVRARGIVAATLLSGELDASSTRLPVLQRYLEIIADEMGHYLERDNYSPTVEPLFEEIVGRSAPFARLREELGRALAVDYPLLISGPSGTGKELVAWLAHHRALGRPGQFVSANCAALPETLLEAELFGSRRGAFTGADRDRPGLVAAARGGTLFLDEVQELSLAAQAKLLRFTESGEYLELGSTQPQRSNARLVCATNADLRERVAAGRYRADLYFRLSVLEIHTPSLAETSEDIPLFVRHFAWLIRKRLGATAVEISAQALEALREASWPGNVRQLIHELERALLRCAGGELLVEHLSSNLRPAAPDPRGFVEERERMIERWETEQLRKGLVRTSGNVSELARELGISRRWLITKLERYGLQRPGR